MKIVNKKEFLQLPEGTLYSTYESCGMVKDLSIKHKSLTSDWWYMDLLLCTDTGGSDEFFDLMLEAENGKQFAMDYKTVSRDGMYEDKALFLVYDKTDIGRLIDVLKKLV